MKFVFPLLAVFVFSPGIVNAQDTMGNRLAAAERYADTFDFQTTMRQALAEMAKNLPESKRQSLLENNLVADVTWLRNLAVNSMVQVFTTDELTALANFYGSQVGRRVLKKFPSYMATFMPSMQRRLAEEARKVLK